MTLPLGLRSAASIALAAASIASGSLAGSRPPARASVSRPPPPPPTTAAAALTISPARTPRATSAGATLATRSTRSSPALPSTIAASPSLALSRSASSSSALPSDLGHRCGEHLGAVDLGGAGDQPLDVNRAVAGRPACRALEIAGPSRAARPPRRDPLGRHAQRSPPPLAEACIVGEHQLDRRGPGDRLDPPHVGRARGLAEDLEQPDLRGRADMRAAAQLAREGPVSRPRPSARRRRTSRRTAPSRRGAWPRRRVVVSARTESLSGIQPFTASSIAASSSSFRPLPWVKSKRSLSGPT